jgi:hypothetical protein
VACSIAGPEGTQCRGGDERGGVTLILPLLLWTAVLAAVVVMDLGGYLVAAARAQSAADAAALAAVAPDVRSPHAAAGRVLDALGGSLERCECRSGSGRVEVTVSVPVPGLVVPRLGASRVTATARAELVP